MHGERPAISFGDATLTYVDLQSEVARIGAGLSGTVTSGDRIAIWLDKRLETVIAMFGVSLAGAIFVPVNPLLRPAQVAHILSDCEVAALITTPERAELLTKELSGCPSLTGLILVDGKSEDLPGGRLQMQVWQDVSTGSAPYDDLDWAPGIDTDPAAIFYTSGSTGKPKGVVVSHRNLIAGATSVNAYLRNDQNDTILAALPLSFDAGFSQVSTSTAAGAHLILHNYYFPREIPEVCEEWGVTALTCVPPLWMQLVEQDWPPDTAARLRYFANTGGRMPRSTLELLQQLFRNASPFLMYGLTEAFRSTFLDPAEVEARPDSIGKAIPNAEVMVVREDGSICDPGEPGELVHRGALVSLGYWNNAEATAERFKPVPGHHQEIMTVETSVWSGDLVRRDHEGFLYFVGRSDEMIKTSGYRVSPTEVEEEILATGLAGKAVVLGIEDERLGQQIVAVVAGDGTETVDLDALRSELRRRLPLFMLPRQIVAMDELPRSPNGKFDRQSIREEMLANE